MQQIVHAVFENGLLRPEESLDLPPQSRVRLIVEQVETFQRPTEAELDEFERFCDENVTVSGEPYLSRDQLHDRT